MRLFFLCIFLLTVTVQGFALHNGVEWFDEYTDQYGISCCGSADCPRTPARLLQERKDTYLVEVNGFPVEINRKAVHPSRNQDSWVCYRTYSLRLQQCEPHDADCIRCVFIPYGS